MRDGLEHLLDRCLERLDQGYGLEEALADVPAPEQARLRPLLELALKVGSLPRVQVPAVVVDEGRGRVLRRAAALRAARQARRSALPSRQWFQRLSRRAAVSLAGASAAAVLVAGVAAAAPSSLPDSPLYLVKLATEQVSLALATDPAARARVLLVLAERRIDEAEAMSQAGQPADELVEQAGTFVDEARRLARQSSSPDLLEEAERVAAREQRALLNAAAEAASAGAQPAGTSRPNQTAPASRGGAATPTLSTSAMTPLPTSRAGGPSMTPRPTPLSHGPLPSSPTQAAWPAGEGDRTRGRRTGDEETTPRSAGSPMPTATEQPTKTPLPTTTPESDSEQEAERDDAVPTRRAAPPRFSHGPTLPATRTATLEASATRRSSQTREGTPTPTSSPAPGSTATPAAPLWPTASATPLPVMPTGLVPTSAASATVRPTRTAEPTRTPLSTPMPRASS